MKYIKKILALVASLTVFSAVVFAEKTPVKDLYQYHLDNGLTLFVNENHSVPLVYIEIAVRAGATTQTPETAGLFHLYEHMMFKGNDLYPDAASVQKALSDMGVSSWNGTTGIDHVNYFFTIPSSELENGLAFWNAAVRSPSMEPEEFEREKKVVLAEIEGDAANPVSLYSDYVMGKLFPDAPYRVDAGGSFPVVANATIAQMRDMQSKFYIPSNAALFVGGDVNPADVYNLVNTIYGDWSNNGNQAPVPGPQQQKDPFSEIELCLLPYDELPEFYAEVEIQWRGPDADYDIADTYPADVLVNMFDDPEGIYKQSLVANEALGIPDYDYVWASYSTSRASGYFDFGGILMSPEVELVDRVNIMLSQIQDEIIPTFVNTASNFSKKSMKKLSTSLKDADTLKAESASALLTTLRSWWISASSDYYFGYNDRIAKVTQRDMQNFADKYFTGKKPIVSVIVNPAVYEEAKEAFAAAGYVVVGDEDITWWKKSEFTPDQSKIPQEVPAVETTPIYRPIGVAASQTASSDAAISVYTLNNGIPVYVQYKKNAKVDAVSIAVKGGVSHLTPQTSGLEDALFSVMASSSKSYSMYDRQTLAFNKLVGISSMSKMSGSALCMTVLDSYYNDCLPVLVDGFLNPEFDPTVVTNLINGARSSVQQLLNDPSSLLIYNIEKDLYVNHPYATKSSVIPESVASINVENMQALHQQLMDPSQIYVVAVGNINGRNLVKTLNKTLGKLPAVAGSDATVEEEIPAIVVQEAAPVILKHPAVAGSGMVARVFAGPANTSDEYIPAALASNIYSSILFNVVRERHGACYTPSSYSVGSKAPYGMEYLFKISDFYNFADYMEEARNYMSQDKLIESVAEDGSYVFSTVEDRLESYKNSYIASNYESQASVSGVLTNLTYNVMQFGDINHENTVMENLAATTAQDVLDVFNKYWVNGNSRWYLIVGPNDVNSLNPEFVK